jgi:UDP-2,3-diacylglucosamine pyrophosphatase LpxH
LLVFISDLHFVDGTAGEHNVPVKAFNGVFKDLATHARNAKAKEVKIVFLGDIFDLLRTEKWLAVPEAERPWGMEKGKNELQVAKEIVKAILNHPENQKTFEILNSQFKKEYQFPVEPEKIYVLGNHDRLCGKFPALFNLCQQALGAANPDPLYRFYDPAYKVIASHGHQHDIFNYEEPGRFDEELHLKVPIGDPVTTELVTRLPYTIMKHQKVKNLPKEERKALKQALQEVENVRPLSATLKWLFYQLKNYSWLEDVFEDSVKEVVENFNSLKFVKAWYKKHDSFFNPWDEADKIQATLFLLGKIKLSRAEKLFSVVTKFIELAPDPLRQAAPQVLQQTRPKVHYLVYGHTHVPLQLPIEVTLDNSQTIEKVYLNTGTWRACHQEAVVKGFITWKRLTYTIIYLPEEDLAPGEAPRNFPSFETWTGTLKQTASRQL